MNHRRVRILRNPRPESSGARSLFLRQAFALLLYSLLTAVSLGVSGADFADFSPILKPATNSEPSTVSNQPPTLANQTAINPPPATAISNQPSNTSSMETLDDKHLLAIGDRLSFRIIEDSEDPKESLDPKPLLVADSGEVEVPYIGRIPAEGKTCRQLAREIKAGLEKEYYYQATVMIAVDAKTTKSHGRVYIVGPVRMPGPQEIPNDETLTLSKAIMRAGGFSDYADRQRVKVTRKGSTGAADKQSFVVDVGQIFDKGKMENDLPLEPGDLILVPERLIRF